MASDIFCHYRSTKEHAIKNIFPQINEIKNIILNGNHCVLAVYLPDYLFDILTYFVIKYCENDIFCHI
jgi:hypothetical protein